MANYAVATSTRTEIVSTIQETMQRAFTKMLNMAVLDIYDEMEAEERFELLEDELMDEFVSETHIGENRIKEIIEERLEEKFSDILERA